MERDVALGIDPLVDRAQPVEQRRRWERVERFVASGYAHAAPWIPISAAAGIIAALYLPNGPETHATREMAVLLGLGFATVVGVVATIATAGRSTPQYANPRAFAQVMERVRALKVEMTGLGANKKYRPEIGLAMARTQLHAVEERLCLYGSNAPARAIDPTWSSGAAYQDLWTGIHRAEEALVVYQGRAELKAGIAEDLLRVESSPLSKLLTDELKETEKGLGSATNLSTIAVRLRSIRRAINEFRDGRWDGLISARNHLVRSALMTAWTAFAIVARPGHGRE